MSTTTVRVRGQFVRHAGYFMTRGLRALLRQPMFVVITLIQPMIWLLLFGQLFRRIVELPGFGAGDYLDFLLPGVLIMTALFSSGWSGAAFVDDMERGIMDRVLTTPVRRGALITGSILHNAIVYVVQACIVLVAAWLMGATIGPGVLLALVAAILMVAAFASLSNAIALLARTTEALIGATQLLVLPLMFLSSTMMSEQVMPDWIATVAAYNPVNWAVVAAREAMAGTVDWAHLGLLAALTLLLGFASTRAFRAYNRSL
ncbi:ABC transporter permease [Nonomuraea sp. NPDC050663]|uniref:ABC transporter permease n=1 Tax=Nonomuraea sp. NPDC050663 TaxID=3364370 RepID=UPI00379A780E